MGQKWARMGLAEWAEWGLARNGAHFTTLAYDAARGALSARGVRIQECVYGASMHTRHKVEREYTTRRCVRALCTSIQVRWGHVPRASTKNYGFREASSSEMSAQWLTNSIAASSREWW